jgi:hypothetical protein
MGQVPFLMAGSDMIHPFSPQLQQIADWLAADGFRLGRGTYMGPRRVEPTLVIDCPGRPEWPGVWYIPSRYEGEAATAFRLAMEAAVQFDKWEAGR